MTARVLTGTKQQIAEQVAEIAGDVREAIVFVDEAKAQAVGEENIFAEMEPFIVQQASADDSRAAIYQRLEAE